MPDSYLRSSIYPTLENYTYTFGLSFNWGFFAPKVGAGITTKYVVIDEDGNPHYFPLINSLNPSHPNYHRMFGLYRNFVEGSDVFSYGGAQYLCRKHSNLSPSSIIFEYGYHEDQMDRHAYIDGVRPVDSMELNQFDPIKCERE